MAQASAPPYSLYDATVLAARGALASLIRILAAAEQHEQQQQQQQQQQQENQPWVSMLFAARLVADMKPLTFQVHYATAQVEAMAARLLRLDAAPEDGGPKAKEDRDDHVPGEEGKEDEKKAREDDDDDNDEGADLDTWEKMRARIGRAVAALDKCDRATVDRLGETSAPYERRGGDAIDVPVKAVVASLNMPNVYFHVAMAYAILRKEGVSLAKRDWSRGFVQDYI
ncbi:hypothetical protein O9K51_05682 [Purpureocillium lavendulum]|uniref:DUF1993 domain-containing protein n=1 Tax=Purpureocillium lavendulum TaxID=1247861 RepID=A0AB34FTD8_9HYPO|nr:hypothetical protein O9K51_05682 [Purpureocillium lavendulum]